MPAAISAILHELDARPELTPPRPRDDRDGRRAGAASAARTDRGALPEVTVRAVYGMTELLPVAIADGAEKLAHAGCEGDFVGRLVSSVAGADRSRASSCSPGRDWRAATSPTCPIIR